MSYRGTPTSLIPKWVREFRSFQQWVDKAPTWIDKDAVCIDAKGRRCLRGADFQRARDEDAFPVRFFWECKESPELAGIASAGGHDACTLADRLMSRADNPPDPEVDVEELARLLQTEEGRTAAFRMMQEDYQDRVDAANLLRAQKLHIDCVDAKLTPPAPSPAPEMQEEARRLSDIRQAILRLLPADRPDIPRDVGELLAEILSATDVSAAVQPPAPPQAEAPAIPPENNTPVRCSECNWCGRADELGPEGECGGEGCAGTAVSEITEPADLIQAWQDSLGAVAGQQCADAGLIEPHYASEQEAAELDTEVGGVVWDLSTKGEVVVAAASTKGG